MLTIGIHGVTDPEGAGRSHDHGVTIISQGWVVYCQELERHTGVKHDGALEDHIEDLLRPFLRAEEPVQFVLVNSFLGTTFRSIGGMLAIDGVQDLEVPDILAECRGRLSLDGIHRPARFFTLSHEVAHLGTCLPFFGAYPPGSLLVHIDGGASRSCASAWFFDGRDLTCLDHGWHAGLKGAVNNFNASLLSSHILGVAPSDHLSMPGKLMGLASHATPDAQAMTWLARRDWLREPREDVAGLSDEISRELPAIGMQAFDCGDQGCQVLAACMQRHLEDEVLAYLSRLREATGAMHLFYSGGAALNILANVRIERELGFATVSIPPAPSDAGLALGAAAFMEWRAGQTLQKHHPFLNHAPAGPLDHGCRGARLPILRHTREAAGAIAEGAIIGVWLGDAEVGPRALGHRSILARPDRVPLRRRLSEQMKQREWYRPVAPMMLPGVAEQALLGYRPDSILPQYMLGAWRVAEPCRQAFSGCIHADKTVRAQVVAGDQPQLQHIHRLLQQLRSTHGIKGVINTSFNQRGLPIAHGLPSALEQAEVMGLDAVWLPW